jgi:hypothetical protein
MHTQPAFQAFSFGNWGNFKKLTGKGGALYCFVVRLREAGCSS